MPQLRRKSGFTIIELTENPIQSVNDTLIVATMFEDKCQPIREFLLENRVFRQ